MNSCYTTRRLTIIPRNTPSVIISLIPSTNVYARDSDDNFKKYIVDLHWEVEHDSVARGRAAGTWLYGHNGNVELL